MTEEKVILLDSVKVKNMIKEVVNHNTIISGYKEQIKEIRDAAKEAGIETKLFNKLVKIYEKDEREKIENENTDLIEMYDTIFQSKESNE